MATSQAVSQYLQELSTKLNNSDIFLLEKKYAAKRICEMDDAEILTNVAESLLRIHVITGWPMPNDEMYMKILAEEFMLKLKEDFTEFNFVEIVYAFRKNGLGIKDWGKNMNLDIVCNVLGNYSDERVQVSIQEEKAQSTIELQQVIYTDEEINNQRRSHIEAAYQCMRNGRMPAMYIYFPEILFMDGLISEQTDAAMTEFFVQRLSLLQNFIYVKE